MLRFYQPLPAKALISLSHIYSWSISQPFSVQLPYHLIVPMGMLSHFANPSVISLLLFYLTSFSNTCTYVVLILTVTSFLTCALSDSQVLIVSWCYNYPLFVAVTSISHDYLSELIIRPDMMIRLSPTQNLTVCCPACNMNSFPNYVMGWGVFLAGTNEWSGLLMHYALCFSVSPTWCTSQNKNHSDRLQLWQVHLMSILEKRQRLWVLEIYWGEPRRENSRPTSLMSHPSSSSPSSPSRFEITLSLFSLFSEGYSHFIDVRWPCCSQKQVTGDKAAGKMQSPLITISPSVSVPHRILMGRVNGPGCLTVAHWLGKRLGLMGRDGRVGMDDMEEQEAGGKVKNNRWGERRRTDILNCPLIKSDRGVGLEGRWWWTMGEIKGKWKLWWRKKGRKGQGEQRQQGMVCCQIW